MLLLESEGGRGAWGWSMGWSGVRESLGWRSREGLLGSSCTARLLRHWHTCSNVARVARIALMERDVAMCLADATFFDVGHADWSAIHAVFVSVGINHQPTLLETLLLPRPLKPSARQNSFSHRLVHVPNFIPQSFKLGRFQRGYTGVQIRYYTLQPCHQPCDLLSLLHHAG